MQKVVVKPVAPTNTTQAAAAAHARVSTQKRMPSHSAISAVEGSSDRSQHKAALTLRSSDSQRHEYYNYNSSSSSSNDAADCRLALLRTSNVMICQDLCAQFEFRVCVAAHTGTQGVRTKCKRL